MIRKKNIILVIIFLLLPLLLIVRVLTNPLLKDNEEIKNNLLEKIPIGTKMEDVIKVIEKKKWKIASNFKEDDYFNQIREQTGKKSIDILLGEYRIVFVTSVAVSFCFDENSELTEIRIDKYTDAL